MLCRFCGTHIEEGEKKCPLCGNAVEREFFAKKKNFPITIVGFVCGLASLIFCVLTFILAFNGYEYGDIICSVLYFVLAIAGIVCGAIELAKKKNSSIAIAGFVCGSLSLVFCLYAVISFFTWLWYLSPVAWSLDLYLLPFLCPLLCIGGLVCNAIAVAKKKSGKEFTIPGLIVSCVTFILYIVYLAYYLLLVINFYS